MKRRKNATPTFHMEQLRLGVSNIEDARRQGIAEDGPSMAYMRGRAASALEGVTEDPRSSAMLKNKARELYEQVYGRTKPRRKNPRKRRKNSTGGYTDCACRDCFEIAIGKQGKALCHACKKAGCEANNGECQAPGAYGGEENPRRKRRKRRKNSTVRVPLDFATNPRRHVPKLPRRGRPVRVRTFKFKLYDRKGTHLGTKAEKTAYDKAKALANRMKRGTFRGRKIAKIVMEW